MAMTKVVMRKCAFFQVASSIVVAGAFLFAQALSAAELQSPADPLDSLWDDQAPAEQNPSSSFGSESQPDDEKTIIGAGSVVPMCSVKAFTDSELLMKGGWPGVGPFKFEPGSLSELVDGSNNKLQIRTDNDNVVQAQLALATGSPCGFMDLELISDFLMESLGIKPEYIVSFNKQLEKNRHAPVPQIKRMDFHAGQYVIAIEKGDRDSSDYAFRVTVGSKGVPVTAAITQPSESTMAGVDEDKAKGSTKLSEPAGGKKPAQAGPGSSGKAAASDAGHEHAPAAERRRRGTEFTDTDKGDELKNMFAETIRSWQYVKKAALKDKQIKVLSEVLTGKALAKQTLAVKWLAGNNKSYEMSPVSVIVDKCTKLGGGTKYAVVAKVHEQSKYMNDDTKQVIKEEDAIYQVNYTLEKINDKWFITDSTLINSSKQPVAQKRNARAKQG